MEVGYLVTIVANEQLFTNEHGNYFRDIKKQCLIGLYFGIFLLALIFFKVGYYQRLLSNSKAVIRVRRKEKEAKGASFKVIFRKICYQAVTDQF